MASIWRDYSRQQGAIVIDSVDYSHLTRDAVRDDASVALQRGTDSQDVQLAIRGAPPGPLQSRLTMAEPAALRLPGCQT